MTSCNCPLHLVEEVFGSPTFNFWRTYVQSLKYPLDRHFPPLYEKYLYTATRDPMLVIIIVHEIHPPDDRQTELPLAATVTFDCGAHYY